MKISMQPAVSKAMEPKSHREKVEDEFELDEEDLYGGDDEKAVQSSEIDVSSGVVLPESDDEEESNTVPEAQGVAIGKKLDFAEDDSSDIGSLPAFSPKQRDEQGISIAMSLPGTHFLHHLNRPTMPLEPDAGLMGTSAPIRIPKSHRTGVVNGSPGARKGFGADFVPPHMLEDHGKDPSELFSPASVKREKLFARNAILRSTGFIEIKQFTAPTGEIIDAVKESAMPEERISPLHSEPVSVPFEPGFSTKPMASSLTALLGTSS